MPIKCTRCGAEIRFTGEDRFIECPYCKTALYIHVEGNTVHYMMKPGFGVNLVSPMVEKWLKGCDYSARPRIMKVKFSYFPFWIFNTASGRRMMPAADVPMREYSDISPSAGKMLQFDEGTVHGAQVIDPSVYASAACDRLKARCGGEVEIVEQNLLHFPVCTVEYMYGERSFELILDGVSGEIHSSELPPPEAESRTRKFALLAAAGFGMFFTINSFLESVPAIFALDLLAGVLLYHYGKSMVEIPNTDHVDMKRRG
ncbi:MAG: hypothetical protein WC889_17085 [Myxococcota bacterium]|jgi:hypothetical protein